MYKVKNKIADLCVMTQDELLRYLSEEILKMYNHNDVEITRNYIYAKGDIPIMLVAHLDTVFNSPPIKEIIFYDPEAQVMWSPYGLGADDRAGVFLILNILNQGYRPYILFATDEEIGCQGTKKFLLNFPSPPQDLNYVIELDRSGIDDCVFYNYNNEDFIDYIESFGFYKDTGSFTDVKMISNVWHVPGVNLSVGYFGEHTCTEMLFLAPLVKTCQKVIKMLEMPPVHFEYRSTLTRFDTILSEKKGLHNDGVDSVASVS